ncbi:ATP-binding protein [Crocosphaera chwakensis]|uniref:Uncharacterized protein n=1 Tax=Crocosphaera chwakensis CCY0110 TaxID=391612 RepID=A3IXB3_9CHRO|nr:DUF499 domain-containing protein [Crocosphaera chwakensis]EAZ88906.1 hypothetical protein CY0110_31940 [Crocosphaera chwakensis CCY0110]
MLSSIFETCEPRAEILSGELTVDLFAAKLRLVVERKAPQVYQNSDIFFANTFATDGIKTLLKEVFSRLTGKSAGSPVIRLETSFGGGKTHDEIALWHICQQGRNITGLDRFVSVELLPTSPVQVAAVDGRDLDPINGIYHEDTGITTYTLWGEFAYQIGGIEGYQLLQASDQSGVSPGTSVMERLIQGKPTVIILDEIARYLSAAKGKAIKDSNLAKQVVNFLFSLMDLAAACNHLIFVYSLASSTDTFAAETIELQELIKASARQERVLTPSNDIEIYNIVKQRLFAAVDATTAEAISTEYLKAYRTTQVNLPDASKDANYAQAIAQSYPFHPELFSLLTKKIASIPEFQKTRGALRLFAQIVRHLWQTKPNWVYLIHTHHIPIGVDEDVTNDLTSRLQRSPMRSPIGADIYNANGREAYAQVQDQEWLLAGKPPFSTWVARTIFLHSLTQGISSGIRRAELNLSLLTPGVEIGFVGKVIDQLVSVAWYLDDDPVTNLSRFKEEPSINKIVTEEKEQVGRTEAKEDLRERRDSIFAKKFFTLISSPESPSDVDDRPDDIALCVIDFQEGTVNSSTDEPPSLVTQIFGNTGDAGKFRLFRNRLLFLVANKTQIEDAMDVAREYKAIKNILGSQTRLEDLSESQQKQLREREGKKNLDVRVALTNAYRHLFYPDSDPVKAPNGLKHYTLPSHETGNVKGKNNQQDVIFKALKDCQKIRSEEPLKPYAPAFILQKVWPVGLEYWTTKSLKETFAKDLGLRFLIEGEISLLRDTIRRGLLEGQWDLKVGSENLSEISPKKPHLYIKTEGQNLILPNTIEFSDRFILYRRGILQPPEPRTIELSAQVISGDKEKQVRVRWKAKEALTITLYQNNVEITGNFLPSDEYECQINQSTTFKVVADYGSGEIAEQETTVSLGGGKVRENGGSYATEGSVISIPMADYKPPTLSFDGTVDRTFNDFKDQCLDNKVQGVESLEVTVNSIMDYRKLGTSLSLLNRPFFTLNIEQTVTIQAQGQFVRLEYQGDNRGFMSFFNTINSLLNSPNAQATINLSLSFEFKDIVKFDGTEINMIHQALSRNPVERLNLTTKVTY